MSNYDDAITIDELAKANRQCSNGVMDKDLPVEWQIHALTRVKALKDSITKGKYKPRKGVKVRIYRPKPRVAQAPWYGDRVFQRSMCNNGVYEDLTRSFIFDNYACQTGKGTDLAIRRIIKMLQRLYRERPGEPIHGIHIDIRKFFPSTPHEETRKLDRKKISDERYLPYLYDIIELSKDERPREEIDCDPYGERGTGLGSQINQLNQVALLDEMDHEMKIHCKYYARYNDDILILDHDKAVIRKGREVAEWYLGRLGLTLVVKQTFTAQHGFCFMRKRFIVTETGKIVVKLHKKALADERRVLRAMKRKLDAGEIDMDHVRRHYQSVIANFEYAGDAPIRAMDKFYTDTFREKPMYKRKKRYLYGKQRKTDIIRTAEKSRGGKCESQGGKQKLSGDAGL